MTAIDNRYFPLKPGTTFLYKGVAENGTTPQTDEMVVTNQTKVILGVTSVVVRDTVSSRGKPIERTFDWYAQDKFGNVWYMGEDSREVENGRFVRTSDSWEAGVKGAEPGIIMPGNPRPGDEYRQEYYPHYALDQARVLGSGGPIEVPYGSFENTLLTVETAPKLDPGVAEDKYYVAGQVADEWQRVDCPPDYPYVTPTFTFTGDADGDLSTTADQFPLQSRFLLYLIGNDPGVPNYTGFQFRLDPGMAWTAEVTCSTIPGQ